jgi:hypothetical protein
VGGSGGGSFPGPAAGKGGCRTKQAMMIEYVIRDSCGVDQQQTTATTNERQGKNSAEALGVYVARGADRVDEFRRVLECLRRDSNWVQSQLFDKYGRDLKSVTDSFERGDMDLGKRICDGLHGLFHLVTCEMMDAEDDNSSLPTLPYTVASIAKFDTEKQVNAICFLNANGGVYIPLHARDYAVVDGVPATNTALKMIAKYRECLMPMHYHKYFRCGSDLDKYELWLLMIKWFQLDYKQGMKKHGGTLPDPIYGSK